MLLRQTVAVYLGTLNESGIYLLGCNAVYFGKNSTEVSEERIALIFTMEQ